MLYYIACDCSRKPNESEAVHSRYNMKGVFGCDWIHKRVGYMCNKVRNALSEAAAEVVNDLCKCNSVFALNDS